MLHVSTFEATENKNLPPVFGSMDDSLPGNLTPGLNPMTGFDLKTTAKEFSSRGAPTAKSLFSF